MARSGLYKSDVKKARDALIAHGKHPSVDAVRIALGNTGSKTTIHKYLKELEAEDAAPMAARPRFPKHCRTLSSAWLRSCKTRRMPGSTPSAPSKQPKRNSTTKG